MRKDRFLLMIALVSLPSPSIFYVESVAWSNLSPASSEVSSQAAAMPEEPATLADRPVDRELIDPSYDYQMDAPSSEEDTEEDMVNDSPFSGMLVTSRSTERRLTGRELQALREQSRESMQLDYRANPLVQLHNKGSSLNLVVNREGKIALEDNLHSLSTMFRQSVVPGSAGLVTFTSFLHCYTLCIDSRGRVYTKDFSVKEEECIFNTSIGWNGITDNSKLVSAVHSNSSHKMYLSLLDLKTNRLAGVRLSDQELQQIKGFQSEIMSLNREWALLTVNETEIELHSHTFKRKMLTVSELTNRRAWAYNYCDKISSERQKSIRKINKYCQKNKLQNFEECKEEYRCVKWRKRTSAPVTCTQRERDQRYGKGWRWNTRNCSSLPSDQRKLCRRTKRNECVNRLKAAGLSRAKSRSRCGAGSKGKHKKCLAKFKGLGEKRAKRRCRKRQKRNQRHEQRSS